MNLEYAWVLVYNSDAGEIRVPKEFNNELKQEHGNSFVKFQKINSTVDKL